MRGRRSLPALAGEVAALVAVAIAVEVGSGVALGAAAVPAHPAMTTERRAAAMSRMRVIMQAPAVRPL
jgi:hypothetical protein